MTADIVLASLHHLLILMYAGIFIAEAFPVRPGLQGANLATAGRLDSIYGGIAGAVIAIGIARVLFGLIRAEAVVFALVPIFAAIMARGVGS